MKPLSRSLSPYLSTLVPLFVIIGTLVYTAGALWPQLQAHRTAIDETRATIAALDEQRANIDVVRQQSTAAAQSEDTFVPLTWTFADEEAFFTFWDDLAGQYHLTLRGPNVSEAVPEETRLLRPATVTLSGSLDNILKALIDVQTHQPLLAILSITLSAPTSTAVTAALELNTVWR